MRLEGQAFLLSRALYSLHHKSLYDRFWLQSWLQSWLHYCSTWSIVVRDQNYGTNDRSWADHGFENIYQ